MAYAKTATVNACKSHVDVPVEIAVGYLATSGRLKLAWQFGDTQWCGNRRKLKLKDPNGQ